MKQRRYFIYLMSVLFLAVLAVGCKPRIDTMAHAEKMFIKIMDKSAGKLDLNEDQKMKLEGLKNEMRKNFQEDGKEGSLHEDQGRRDEGKSGHREDDFPSSRINSG